MNADAQPKKHTFAFDYDIVITAQVEGYESVNEDELADLYRQIQLDLAASQVYLKTPNDREPQQVLGAKLELRGVHLQLES